MSGASEQVTRLLALAPYLQSRQGVPLSEVAADFGVSPKQVVRDLKVLWMCGLPGLGPGDLVEIDFESFEDDPDGLVRIGNAEFLSRPVRLGSTEASALMVALRALQEGSSVASREVIDRALAKLEDATMAGTAHVEVHLPEDQLRTAGVRRLLDEAIRDDRQVRLSYYVPSRDETTLRIVDPLALLQRDGKDYLDAWCHAAQGRRLFRLSRAEGVEVLNLPRQAPDLQPRDLSDGLFDLAADNLQARVRLVPELRWVSENYPVTSVTEAAGGSLDVLLPVAEPMWLVRLALQLAPGFEVLEPASLGQLVEEIARGSLRLYHAGGVA